MLKQTFVHNINYIGAQLIQQKEELLIYLFIIINPFRNSRQKRKYEHEFKQQTQKITNG